MSLISADMKRVVRNLQQLLAVFGLIFIVSIVLHKGYVGISALAQKHSGEEFWLALARYLMQNLAGG